MGMNLEEMDAMPEPESVGTVSIVHVAVVEDEETGIVSRQPIRFCLAPGGSLEAQVHMVPTKREDPDFHLGHVGAE